MDISNLRYSFADVPRNLLEYKRHLYELKYSEQEIDCLCKLFEPSKKLEFTSSEYGRVIRKQKDKNKENPNYFIVPYGIKDGKILLPDYYNRLIEKYGLETIYNLSMCVKNIHFWFLLCFDQKVKLYNLLETEQNVKVFGSRDRSKTFMSLFEELCRYCFYADDISISAIKLMHIDSKEQTPEMKQMIQQNLDRFLTLNNFIFYLNDTKNFDTIIRQSLHEYIPFIWYLVHDKIEVVKLDESNFFINGSPKITTLSFTEPGR